MCMLFLLILEVHFVDNTTHFKCTTLLVIKHHLFLSKEFEYFFHAASMQKLYYQQNPLKYQKYSL